ncbi:MAG: flavodoxin family protein [Christensenellales bacterium]
MKVLMINGSPNARGCTNAALREIAKTLAECGVESEIVHIGKGPFRGCIACGGCAKDRRCVFDDDCVNDLIDKMEHADGLIVGSPVHFASAAGAIVSVLDRMFVAGNCYAHKPAAAVASARRAGTTVTVDGLNKYFSIKQMPVVSSSYWNVVHGAEPEEVQKDLEGLQTMRNLARNMAWLLKCIRAGKEQGILPPENESGARTNFIS